MPPSPILATAPAAAADAPAAPGLQPRGDRRRGLGAGAGGGGARRGRLRALPSLLLPSLALLGCLAAVGLIPIHVLCRC